MTQAGACFACGLGVLVALAGCGKRTDSGSTAYVVYEKNGLPDHSRDHAAAYGYQIGYTPSFEDVFLAQGGLRLDGSNFVDIELTTVPWS